MSGRFRDGNAEPVKPPPGGYNDFHPPPPVAVQDPEVYASRVRRGDRAPGAAWRLCELLQPRSVQQLIGFVVPDGMVASHVGLALADAFSDWVAAGKPATHR
jgi:hypothetical protein